MPDATLVLAVALVQLLLLLLIPIEMLLASRSWIRAEYDARDTLANVGVSVGSIFFWGTLSWILLGVVDLAYQHRRMEVPFVWWTFLLAFVAEDFRYYWEDVATNSKLTPDGLPPALLVNGMPPQVEVLDQTTIRYTWVLPNQAFLPALAAATPLMIYRPSRYLKQFNPKYTSAKVIARFLTETKLDSWEELHEHFDDPLLLGNPDMPVLSPWVVISRPGSQVFAAVRNPYYYRIDKDGQQLPYIDRLVLIPQSKSQILSAVVDGKSDLQAAGLSLPDIPALKAAAEKGVIRLNLWPSGRGSQLALYPNLNAKDPVWQKLLRDLRGLDRRCARIGRAHVRNNAYAVLHRHWQYRAHARFEQRIVAEVGMVTARLLSDRDRAFREAFEYEVIQRTVLRKFDSGLDAVARVACARAYAHAP